MLAPQVVIALAHKYQMTPERVYLILSHFFKQKLGVSILLDLWEGIQLCHELAYE